jgi:hypothetical protein
MDEQISFYDALNGTEEIYNKIKDLLKDSEKFKPELLKYKPLKGTSSSKVASIYVGTVLMCKIYIKSKSKYILVREKLEDLIIDSGIIYKKVKSEKDFIRIPFGKPIAIENIKKVLYEAYLLALKEYSVEPFGCCYRYEECSNAKKCIHPDKKFALGCKYKENLEHGKIFYGINKNVR